MAALKHKPQNNFNFLLIFFYFLKTVLFFLFPLFSRIPVEEECIRYSIQYCLDLKTKLYYLPTNTELTVQSVLKTYFRSYFCISRLNDQRCGLVKKNQIKPFHQTVILPYSRAFQPFWFKIYRKSEIRSVKTRKNIAI